MAWFFFTKEKALPGILSLLSIGRNGNRVCWLVPCSPWCFRKRNSVGEAGANNKRWGHRSKCDIVQLDSYEQPCKEDGGKNVVDWERKTPLGWKEVANNKDTFKSEEKMLLGKILSLHKSKSDPIIQSKGIFSPQFSVIYLYV